MNPDSREGRFVAGLADHLEQIRNLFAEGLTDASRNYQAADGQKNTTREGSNVQYMLRDYSQHQKENWSNSKSIVIYESERQLRMFVSDSLNGVNLSKKMYFGAIPEDLAARIKQDTGLNVESYNCTLRASEIRKIFSDHGNENTEDLRGQRAITEDDIVSIPEIIQSPDEIRLSDKLFEGKQAIEFVKTINGKTTVVTYVSVKHKDLTVQTMYSGKNKGNLATAAGDQAPANTPEAHVGTVPSNSIRSENEKVKKKFSMREPVEYTKDLVALHNLTEESENYQANVSGQKNTTREGEADIKYSIREGMTEEERYEDLKDKIISVFSDSRTVKYADEIDSLEALETKAKSKAEKIIKPLAKKLGIINTPLSTTDVETEFLFTTSGGLSESMHKQLRYGGSYVDFAKTLINLDHVLETAVLIEAHGDKYAGTSRANENLESVYVLFGAFRDGRNIIPVQMEIKKSSDIGGRLYLTVAMTKIEADVVGSAPGQIRTPFLLPASKYSLAEIFKKINPRDGHFLKYLPDGMLSEDSRLFPQRR